MRALLSAVLDRKEGAEAAYTQFERELFPEKVVKDQAFDTRAKQILETQGDAPIAVEAFAQAESQYAASFKRRRLSVRVGPRKESG